MIGALRDVEFEFRNRSTDDFWFTGGFGAYVEAVDADNPISHWRFGELEGPSIAIDRKGVVQGRFVGGVSRGQTGLLPASSDTAYSFDGSTGRIDIPRSATHESITTAVSLEVWVKPTLVATQAGYVYSGPRFDMFITDVGRPVFRVRSGGGWESVFPATSAGNLSSGSTYHLVGTFNGSVLILYRNGVEIARTNYSGTLDANTAVAYVGSGGSVSYYTGILDEVAMYGSALSQARAQAHYDAGVGSVVTAPTANVVSTSRNKISRVVGFDLTDVVWTSDKAFSEYQFRVVSSASDPVTSGVQVEANQNPASGGTANTQYTSTLTDDEIVATSPAEGTKIVKLFVKNEAGWSS